MEKLPWYTDKWTLAYIVIGAMMITALATFIAFNMRFY